MRSGSRTESTSRRFPRAWTAGRSGGGTRSSAVNYPLVHVRSLDGSHQAWLVPDPRQNFWDDPMTLTFSDLPSTLDPEWYYLTVFSMGLPSESRLVEAVRHTSRMRKRQAGPVRIVSSANTCTSTTRRCV